QGELDKAIDDLSEAIRLDPVFAEAFFARSLLYVEKGDRVRGQADYERAIKLNPALAKKCKSDQQGLKQNRKQKKGSLSIISLRRRQLLYDCPQRRRPALHYLRRRHRHLEHLSPVRIRCQKRRQRGHAIAIRPPRRGRAATEQRRQCFEKLHAG